MIGFSLKALAIAGLLASPAIAQGIAPGIVQGNAQAGSMPAMPFETRGGPPGHRMFGAVSPEGRAILRQAMRDQGSPDDRAKLRVARDRVAAVLSAETLDARALKRAMDDERQLVDAQHARRQSAMLTAFQKLSFADRKAFVEDAKRGRDRLDDMVRPDGGGRRAKRIEMMPPTEVR